MTRWAIKFLQAVCLRSRYFLARHFMQSRSSASAFSAWSSHSADTHQAKFTLAQRTAKNNVIKHLNEEKYEIDQKFIFDLGIFYLPMTIKRSYAVK